MDEFRHRPLDDAGPFTFVAAYALTMKVREGGRVVSCQVLVATGVNNDGHREVLGCAYPPVRPLRPGRSSPLTWSPEASPACAWSPATHTWAWLRPSQRTCLEPPGNGAAPTTPRISCQSPPKRYGPPSKRCCTRCNQPDAASVNAQYDRLLDYVHDKLPAAWDHLDQARADVLAFASFPTGVGTQIWSNNPNERLNREIRRRFDSVGIFPNRQAIIGLVGAVLAEQNDEWAEGRRYLSLDILTTSRLAPQPTQQEGTPLQLSA